MPILICPNCGQTYDTRYMMYCARCGEALPDERGRRPKPGPLDGMGARGGATTRLVRPPVTPVGADGAREGAAPAEPWQPTQAVEDMVLEYQNRLNKEPADHAVRYALALAYSYAGQCERAAAELVAVLAAMPEYADAWDRLARCLVRLGDLPAALEAARRAQALEPTRASHAELVERLESTVGGNDEPA